MVIKTSGIAIISAAIGEGARDGGCKFGASALLQSGIADALTSSGRFIVNRPIITADAMGAENALDVVGRFSVELAYAVEAVMSRGGQALALGGDHSCAIGTWSGMAKVLKPKGELGLIWIDAHLDAHTWESSESKALHGMPLAALLGYGSKNLTDIYGWSGKLKAENTVVIGARSYELGEKALLDRLGVRVMYMDEVHKRGFEACFHDAKQRVARGTAGWGVSFDLDGLDPQDAPATGTPVEAGIRLEPALRALASCRHDHDFVGLEIAEYNPLRDFGGQTARAVQRLAVACLGNTQPVTLSELSR